MNKHNDGSDGLNGGELSLEQLDEVAGGGKIPSLKEVAEGIKAAKEIYEAGKAAAEYLWAAARIPFHPTWN
jgi:hypothetical protein